MLSTSNAAIDARARRAAARCGLRAIKSKIRNTHYNNEGQYMLVNERNCVVDGSRSELSAEDVIDICTPE